MRQWTARRRAAAGVFGLLLLASLIVFWHEHHGPAAEAAGPGEAVSAAPAAPAAVVPPGEISVPGTPLHPPYTLYTPGGVQGGPPPPVTLVVLHGMGGNGPGMAALVLPFARSQGWAVIAPTVAYGEWRDPGQLTREELDLQPKLLRLLDGVGAETGVAIGPKTVLFGFSRGAQTALRFAVLYPDRVQAVAACSAGTYTLPTASVKTAAGTTLAAPLPFGVADLEQRAGRGLDASALSGVRFLIGVGARDNREGDVPRQWDAFVGKTRVERAERFAATLSNLGLKAQYVVFPDTGHELSGPMVEQVLAFLANAAAETR
jgi:predicted esterase